MLMQEILDWIHKKSIGWNFGIHVPQLLYTDFETQTKGEKLCVLEIRPGVTMTK